MTITLKPWMTMLIIATLCVLGGFAASQITQANSAPDATASSSSIRYLRYIDRSLDNIEEDADETCRALVKYKFVCN